MGKRERESKREREGGGGGGGGGKDRGIEVAQGGDEGDLTQIGSLTAAAAAAAAE